MGEWQPIETAPFMETVLVWGPGWRCGFPGKRYGEYGAVMIDTCELEAKGRPEYATHWMPLPEPPK